MRPRDEFDRPFPVLGEMMERLGLDPILALQCEAATLAQAICHCQVCESESDCRAWLARSAVKIDASPEFCAISELLTHLRDARPPADIGTWL
jgi:hypothetical protein